MPLMVDNLGRTRSRRLVKGIVQLLLAAWTGVGCLSAAMAENDNFTLSAEGELLTLSANNASLVAIVAQLSELTNISITFSEPFDDNITIDVESTDLEALINQLARNSLITKLDYKSHIKIAEILLMPDGGDGGNNLASLPSGEPTEGVVVDGNDPLIETAEDYPERKPEAPPGDQPASTEPASESGPTNEP